MFFADLNVFRQFFAADFRGGFRPGAAVPVGCERDTSAEVEHSFPAEFFAGFCAVENEQTGLMRSGVFGGVLTSRRAVFFDETVDNVADGVDGAGTEVPATCVVRGGVPSAFASMR